MFYCKVEYDIVENICNDYTDFKKVTKEYTKAKIIDVPYEIDEDNIESFWENPNSFLYLFESDNLILDSYNGIRKYNPINV